MNHPVSIDHLRIFGSKVTAHIPKQKRRKLDNPGRDGVLVGYAEDQKGYRVLFGEELQIVCNVRVFEGTFVNSSGPTTTSSPVVVDFDEDVGEEDQQEADDPDLSLYEVAEAGEVEWPESAAEDNSAQELLRPAP